jgi:DNA-binding SARP family transcriptional activator
LRIRLLGSPQIEHDGEQGSPRGHKAWGLLAYLILCRQPPSRSRLAELLFSEADDPLGALRWSLAQLRQAFGQPSALRGDPVDLGLDPGSEIDLLLLRSGHFAETDEIDCFTGELLEGMNFAASPAFETWLAIERRHLAAIAEGLLLERAQAELGAGRPAVAARFATRLLELNSLEESHHEILVRSLVAAGDREEARARVTACEELLKREFGAPPLSRLREIVHAAERPSSATAVASAAAARAQLEMGKAAIAAGAIESGLDSLRRACVAAEGCRDDYLNARAGLALGSALVHGMRAYGEAAVALHRAVAVARRIGAEAIAATAHRELAFVDVQAGRYAQVEPWLTQATEEAAGSEEELASIAGVRGMGLSDGARYEEALEALEESVERALQCEHRRQVAWSLALIGRVHVLTGNHSRARKALDRALELVEEEKWIAFEPFPESMLANVDLRENRKEEARDGLEHAFTIACQVADPCWEGIACRGLGLVEAANGKDRQALAWMLDGRTRCTRVAHPYQWIQGWLLDGLCTVGDRDERAGGWVDELESLASRTGLRELLLRAYLHRARRGDSGARDAARLLGSGIDNPAVWPEHGA